MAFNVKAVAQEVRTGRIEFEGGQVLNFEFRPNAYTPNMEDAVEAARSDDKASSTLKAWLVPLLASWDVVDEAPGPPDPATGAATVVQTPVPITEDGFGDVPISVLGKIMTHISESMAPGEAKSTASAGSFT